MGSEIGGVLWSIRARALYELGRYDDAQDAVRKGDQLFSDLSTSLLQRSTEAMILAHRGLLPDAERIARDAVIQMDTSDWPSERGDMRMALAEILRLAGKMDESAEMMREAVALYESKGNALQAGTARTKLAALTG
jgi:tetratricopeptide (TPR) repeat protein